MLAAVFVLVLLFFFVLVLVLSEAVLVLVFFLVLVLSEAVLVLVKAVLGLDGATQSIEHEYEPRQNNARYQPFTTLVTMARP